MEEVIIELDNDDSQPMEEGSDDQFNDIVCMEKERDEYGGIIDDCDDDGSMSVPDTRSPPL